MKHLKKYNESVDSANRILLNDIDVIVSIASDLTDMGYVSRSGFTSGNFMKYSDVKPTFVVSSLSGNQTKHMDVDEYQKYISDNFETDIPSIGYMISCSLDMGRAYSIFGGIPTLEDVKSLLDDIKSKVTELCPTSRISTIKYKYNIISTDSYTKGKLANSTKLESTIDIHIYNFKKIHPFLMSLGVKYSPEGLSSLFFFIS